VLYTLGQLAGEFPEVSNDLAVKLQEADLRIPSKPPGRNATASIASRTPVGRNTPLMRSESGRSAAPLSSRSQRSED